jgi:N6-L-threonylcarbamoyladenine synthase/protein kinase Bud32
MIGKGAEAELRRDGDRLVKERVVKGYRHPDLDRRLREDRTEQEARLLERAKQAGVQTPDVLDRDGTSLVMSFIDGDKLRDVFEDRDDLWERIGKDIGRLHDRDIIHGDLTTSNIIVRDDEPVFIDFGLGFFSQRTEDRATDLRLLDQVLEATHYTVADAAFGAIVDGYQDQYSEPEDVLDRLEDISDRGRYSG